MPPITPTAATVLAVAAALLAVAALAAWMRTRPRRQHVARPHRDWVAITGHGGTAVLVLVGVVGAALSYDNLRREAANHMPEVAAWGMPLLVDTLILGCTMRYVSGIRQGRYVPGHRWTAHIGIGATIILNGLASNTPGGWPWHIAAPVAWAVVLELLAKDALGEYRAAHGRTTDRIPARLWFTDPLWCWRASVHMGRTGTETYTDAMTEVGHIDAAVQALRLAVPLTGTGPRGFATALAVRRTLRHHLRRRTLSPERVIEATRTGDDARPGARAVLAHVLGDILAPRAPRPARRARVDAPPAARAPLPPETPTTDTADAPPALPPVVEHAPAPRVATDDDAVYAMWRQRLAEGGGEMTVAEIKAAKGLASDGGARNARLAFRRRDAAAAAAEEPARARTVQVIPMPTQPAEGDTRDRLPA